MEYHVRYLALFGNRVVLDGKSSQEYLVTVGVPQGSILVPTLFLQYINDIPVDVICNIAIYADKCNQLLVLHLLPLMAHCQNIASLSLFYRYYFCRCSSELVPLPILKGGVLAILIDCMIFL